ncbi:N-formylglutamate amidohydrolase [Rhodospirillales bacterium]|nr:N-formylglutamate amidohydrolase [Rhodospirillales bacterium]
MPDSNLIFHVPHSSTVIPDSYRSHFSLDDDQLLEEIRLMTDWHTAELFGAAKETHGSSVEFPVSRLLVDPERFPDDGQECMAAVGMGALYIKTSHGKELRLQKYTSDEHRSCLLDEFYFPHHEAFHKKVEDELNRNGSALIIDCHSFPNRPLPYENDQNPDRPDICIGTDNFHTPNELSRRLKTEFSEKGYSVKLNSPFSGAIVPQQFYLANSAVKSVMIEVNRGLYMNEETTEKKSAFSNVRRDIASVLVKNLVKCRN